MKNKKTLALLHRWIIVTHLAQILLLGNWWMGFVIPFNCVAIAFLECKIKEEEDLWERDKEAIIGRLIYEEQMEDKEC